MENIDLEREGDFMPNDNKITDTELYIMKVLWKNGPLTSHALFAQMETESSRSKGTLKTLLARLVRKGAIRREGINERHYMYYPAITEDEYITKQRRRLIDRMFDGSAKNLLLNLIREEELTYEDLEQLLREIKEGKS